MHLWIYYCRLYIYNSNHCITCSVGCVGEWFFSKNILSATLTD
jgi:hypothetical protein